MTHAKHRKPTRWHFWYMVGLTVVGLTVIAACAASNPTPAQGQEPPPAQATQWKPMAVGGLEYACDPVLGVIVKHQWHQNGMGSTAEYENWAVSVTPYSQLSSSQQREMCGVNR